MESESTQLSKMPNVTRFSILREIDTNNNGKVELEEYLAVMCAIKTGAVSHSRFASMAEAAGKSKYGQAMERSGGGV